MNWVPEFTFVDEIVKGWCSLFSALFTIGVALQRNVKQCWNCIGHEHIPLLIGEHASFKVLDWDSMARRFYVPVVDFTRLP